jgi:hypothetical protein
MDFTLIFPDGFFGGSFGFFGELFGLFLSEFETV